MILTCDVIRCEIEAGRVVIQPFFADQVGPASIDLHLGDEIRVMHTGREPVPVTEDVDYRTITDVRSLETPYPLAPGETIHGITLLGLERALTLNGGASQRWNAPATEVPR